MPSYDFEQFSRDLITETLFYEENFGLVGTISLVDVGKGRECYLASFDPDDGVFILEEATEWAAIEENERDYELALEGTVIDTYTEAASLAQELLERASRENLKPYLQILYEDVG